MRSIFKKIVFVLSIVLLIFVINCVFRSLFPYFKQNVCYSSEDWLTGWNDRKAILIDNTEYASSLTDYQVEVDLEDAIYDNTGLVGSWHMNEYIEPTTNIVTNTDLSNGSWGKYYNSNISYNYSGPTNAIVAKFTDADTDERGYWYSYGDYAPQADGTTYTISLWVKTEDTISIRAYTADNVETGRKSTDWMEVTPSDGWKRVVWDPITTDNPNDSDSLSFNWTGLASGKYLQISSPQMEAKDHATAFTVGSRNLDGDKNEIDPSTWTIGSGSVAGFNVNGATSENYRILSENPFGDNTVIWEARPESTSGPDGGWNTPSFNIDNTKKYRFSVWVRRPVQGNGHFYLGTRGYGSVNGVAKRSDGTVNTNPYFTINSNWNEWGDNDSWYLAVGHVWPAGSGTGSNYAESGIYNTNGDLIYTADLTDYVWLPETKTSNYRTYLFYSTDTSTRQQWAFPRVDIVDGTEPSIEALISGGPDRSIEDSSGENNGGVIKSFPEIVNGKFGKARGFDGSGDHINMGNPSSLQTTGDLTIEFWAKPANIASGRQNPICKSYGAELCLTQETNGSLSYYHGSAGGNASPYVGFNTGNMFTDDTWVHVVITRDVFNRTVISYKNGSLASSANWTSDKDPSVSSYDFKIGAGYVNTYNGLIDEVRIYNRILSAEEISDHYNATKARLDYGDIRFTDSDGTTTLNYWLESDKTAWVKVPSIPASSKKNIYMYHGNASVSDDSDGDNTFEFFDDFEKFDGTKWNQDSGTWTAETFGGKSCIAIEPGSNNNYLRAKNTNFSSNWIIESSFYTTQSGDSLAHPGVMFYASNGYNDHFYLRPHSSGEIANTAKAYYDGSLHALNIGNSEVSWDTWYNMQVILRGDNVDLLVNGTAYNQSGFQYDGIYDDIGLVSHASGKNYFDYIRVRQYVSPEPSVTVRDAYFLEMIKTGTGSGTVTSNPTGIDCGETCSFAFDPGTGVTLTAEEDPDHNFVGWSGEGCTGTGDCILTMDSDKSVTVEFSGPPCQEHNIGGWAWSENIGWISFSCQNENAIGEGIDYGIDIDENIGVLSGQAWSENIGWISFDLSETGNPPSEPDYSNSGYIAKLDTSSYDLSGWARALSASSTENGEWNGWIKLTWSTGSETGSVSLNGSSKEFEGYAWGGNESDINSKGVIGWISFNDKDYDSSPGPVDYQVTTTMNFGPTVSNLSASYSCSCDQSRIPNLSWNVSGADPNYDYEVRFCSDEACTNVIFSESAQNTPSTQWAPSCNYCCNSSPYNSLLWNSTYYYQVRVSKAGEGNWSSWTSGTEGLTTPIHCYPFSYFLCSYDGENWYDCDQDVSDGKCAATDACQGPIPFLPPAEEKIYVKDFSICHNPDNTSFDAIYCSSEGYNEESCPAGTITTYYDWDFVNATSSDGTQDFASSTIEILETGEWGMSVTTTDTHSPDQSCGHEEGGQSGLPLPDWIEISPY